MADDPISKYLLAVYPKKLKLVDGVSVTVRTLIPQDRAEVGTFFERVPEEDRAFLKEDLLNREEVEIWLDEIDLDRETVMVAEVDKHIAGTAVLERQRNGWSRHVGEIRIVADPAFRRRGLGHALARRFSTSPKTVASKSLPPRWWPMSPGRFESSSGSAFAPRPR